MKNRDDALVRRILEYCSEVEDAVELFGKSEEKFAENKVYRNAVCMPVLQIGELCKLVSDDMRNSYSKVDLRGWCGIRDILAHQYTNLNYKKAWKIVNEDLPKLKSELLIIAKEIDNSSLERISMILEKYKITDISADDIYKNIVKNTGVSLNSFSDEKLLEFIKKE